MALSDDVEYIVLYRLLPTWAHGYILPFILFYVTLISGWVIIFEGLLHVEALLICVAVIAALNIVTCLSCVWSIHIRCLLTCRKVPIGRATHVKVVPTPNNGRTELVLLRRDKDVISGREIINFLFQKIKYIYNSEDEGTFIPIDFPIDKTITEYRERKGFLNEQDIHTAIQKYGLNKLTMISPDFWTLFRERATAPFFVFQVFCVGLWCLDEYWYYSIFTLMMLVMFEALLVQQQKRNLAEIRKMGATPYNVQVYRGGHWMKISTENLLPGDVVSFGRNYEGHLVPCDILLLRGSCIVDESMLTGESVPQMKEAVESCLIPEGVLNIARDGKLHVVFGGTRIVQHTPPNKEEGLRGPDSGCVGYVLRTGFNTAQGKLLRTILYGVKRVTANNLETFMFIMFLLIFAIMASVYVWIKGTENPERNRYKLFLECTLILTSVVPPELPIELSLAVNTSLISLAKIGIYCTEPFRIPFGGKVDICCFDKTGTLTSDNLVVNGIGGLNSSSTKVDLVPANETPFQTQCVLGSCHALSLLDNELIGDPLEKAAIKAVEWKISKNDVMSPLRGFKCSLKVNHRFHFSSALKRMSVVSAMTTPSQSTPTYIACVKGAPEIIKTMLTEIPANYDTIYLKLAKRGERVLALGYRDMGRLSLREASELKREDVEKTLSFVGFLAISCPLKRHTKECVRELQDSSHHVIMITGDNPLTACHVAKELKITNKEMMILQPSEGVWFWETINGDVTHPYEQDRQRLLALDGTYQFCLTGPGLQYVQTVGGLDIVLPFVKVFARVSPKQKELIINTLKSCGFYTLMCGDGTNDVGALKHAHVGVSLLSTVRVNPQEKPSESTSSQLTRSSLSSVRQRKNVKDKSVSTQTPPRNKILQDFIKKSEENLRDPALVRLGDASIASPFTSRETNIKCICHVIKQGRCTLVTTLQMFKILALNALILAYSQSVLYLDGIKFSDLQATLQGILLAGCFLFISRSKPLDMLSKSRPLPNIFNIYTVMTVCLQFVVHFACLVYLVREAKVISPPSEEEFVDLEKEFEQNVLNSAVYIISVAMQISNFAVNYKGYPFMVGLTSNKPLLYSLLMTTSVVLMLASGLVPDLCQWLEIVEFPVEFQTKLLVVLTADFFGSLLIDRVLSYGLGTAKLRQP